MKSKILFLLCFVFACIFFLRYEFFNKSVTDLDIEFYIPNGLSFEELIEKIDTISMNLNPLVQKAVPFFIEKKRLAYWFRPGRYILLRGSSFNDVINKLRSQSQDPVKITFNSMDEISPIFGIAGRSLELDSIDLVDYFNSINFPLDSLYFYMIPNTYEFFWNVSPDNFFQRIKLEYRNFWSYDRLDFIKNNNLSKHEVFVLASIVDKEASHFDEMPRIAGLYLNRLKEDWQLASDPTIIYIWKKTYNKSIRRVRNKHINATKKSLFNTYHHKGLPPLPICVPSLQAINAVLTPEKHNYMYMCAKPDNSEYHDFAITYKEHQKNANAFHRWLNKRKIY